MGVYDSPEWQEVADRIAKGEFSMAELVQGKVVHHPAVVAAVKASRNRSANKLGEYVDDDDYFANWSLSV